MTKKELILEEAKKMFASKGYAATIMDDLAKVAGVNKATIYYHYKDKASLYETLFFEGVKKIADETIQKSSIPKEPYEKLKEYIKAYAKRLKKCEHLTSILLRELASGGESMPKSVLEQLFRTTKRLTTIIEECTKSSKTICQEPMLIQLMIVSTLSTFITTEPIRKRVKEEIDSTAKTLPPLSIEEVAEKLAKMIIKNLQEEKI